jgi:uncharacterized protein YjbI with pentapeptide repeats
VTLADGFSERWGSADGVLLAGEVLARLRAGAALDGLGLGEVAGRVDLRGFPAPLPRPVSRAEVVREQAGRFDPRALWRLSERVVLDGVALRGLDLSGARLDEVGLRDCVVEDCALAGISGREMTLLRVRVRGCSLQGADLRGTRLGSAGYGEVSDYEGVDFSGADLSSQASIVTAWFRDCDFCGARLDGKTFARCGLVRCRFAGVLQDVQFLSSGGPSGAAEGPDQVEELDLSGAELRNVTIRGMDPAAIRLPGDPAVRFIHNYPCVMRKAARAMEGRQDRHGASLRLWFNDLLRGIDLGLPVGLLNLNDYVRIGGEELAALADSVIEAAERECASQ